MKYIFAAITLLMTVAGASAETAWQGDLFVKTATSKCSAIGTNAGDFYQAIFQPKGLPGNTSSDQFSYFGYRGFTAQMVAKQGSFKASASIKVTIIQGASIQSFDYNIPSSFKISPSQITASTPSINMSWTSTDWGVTGCTVTFSAILAPKPGNLIN